VVFLTRKKVLVSLPEALLLKMDSVSLSERINRSELICEAMQHYLSEKEWAEIRERMKVGYLQMSYINREWAELGVAADGTALEEYETMLAEGEP
jgi:CopG family transcriptional regulator/antitoxin EndoAI